MKYLPLPDAEIYKNEDELYADCPEYDYIIIATSNHTHITIGSFEAKVWQLLQQGLEPSEIIAELSVETGMFEELRVMEILKFWEDQKLIFTVPDDFNPTTDPIKKYIPKVKKPLWQKLTWLDLPLKNIDGYLSTIYNNLGKYLFTKIGMILIATIIAIGLTLLAMTVTWASDSFLQIRPPFIWVFLTAIGCLFLHEMGHGMAMKWAGAPVHRGGMALYLGFPVFFVDTSPSWAKKKSKRIVISLAGMVTNLTIFSIASIILFFASDVLIKSFMFEVMVINLFSIGFSLIPFLKMDGYYVLIDLIGVPNLEAKSKEEVKLSMKDPMHMFTRRKYFYLIIYAILNSIASAFLLIYSFWYWSGWVMVFVR